MWNSGKRESERLWPQSGATGARGKSWRKPLGLPASGGAKGDQGFRPARNADAFRYWDEAAAASSALRFFRSQYHAIQMQAS
jgi:hypothetical protein